VQAPHEANKGLSLTEVNLSGKETFERFED
jgi:hypothetical protein